MAESVRERGRAWPRSDASPEAPRKSHKIHHAATVAAMTKRVRRRKAAQRKPPCGVEDRIAARRTPKAAKMGARRIARAMSKGVTEGKRLENKKKRWLSDQRYGISQEAICCEATRLSRRTRPLVVPTFAGSPNGKPGITKDRIRKRARPARVNVGRLVSAVRVFERDDSTSFRA
jgi:hypothetical protein